MADSPLEKAAFERGYLIAVSIMLHLHGCTTTAANTIDELGLTWAKVRKHNLDDFDLDVLRPVFKEMADRKKWDRECRKRMTNDPPHA